MPVNPPRFNAKPSGVGDDSSLTPEFLSRQEFARRLQAAMLRRGMNQAALARRAFGTLTDKRGYEVPKGKDSLSGYLSGKRLPGPTKLAMLARALDMEPEELLPNALAAAADKEHLSFSMRELAGHPGNVWVTLDRLLPTTVAVKIAAMIAEADAANA